MKPNTGEIWQHYRTKGEYEILGIAKLQVKRDVLDMAECVMYKALYDGSIWVRPLVDFLETIDDGKGTKKFIKIR